MMAEIKRELEREKEEIIREKCIKVLDEFESVVNYILDKQLFRNYDEEKDKSLLGDLYWDFNDILEHYFYELLEGE